MSELRRELESLKTTLQKTRTELVAAQAEVSRLKTIEDEVIASKKGTNDKVSGLCILLSAGTIRTKPISQPAPVCA